MSDEKHAIDAITSMGGIGILGAISRTILSEDRRSFIGFLRGLCCATFVVYLAGGIIDDYRLEPGLHNLLIGVCAFVADDILLLVIKTTKMITVNPGKALDWAIDFLIGLRTKK